MLFCSWARRWSGSLVCSACYWLFVIGYWCLKVTRYRSFVNSTSNKSQVTRNKLLHPSIRMHCLSKRPPCQPFDKLRAGSLAAKIFFEFPGQNGALWGISGHSGAFFSHHWGHFEAFRGLGGFVLPFPPDVPSS